jgi:hypothetical protein
MQPADVARAYVEALEGGSGPALVALLSPRARFVSPFSVWSEPRSVAAACQARTRAFHGVLTISTMTRGDHASIRWHGLVGDQEVEGVDLLAVDPSGITTIDVFLRPASALDAVYAAMTTAWPTSPI